jgi:hypothetical protein
MPPQTSPRIIALVTICITFLATLFSLAGAYLLWKGFQSGELLVGGALTAAGTLGALLSSTRTTAPPDGTTTHSTTTTTTAPAISGSGTPVTVVNSPAQPVPTTTEQKPTDPIKP